MTSSVTNDPNISWESKDHTLNAYIELVYIRFGNQMITEQLGQLNAALSTTDNAVNVIKDIMAMRDMAITTKDLFTFEEFAKNFNPETGFYQPGYGLGFTYDKVYGNADEYLKQFNAANKAYETYKTDNQSHVFGYDGKAWTKGSADPAYWDWAQNILIQKGNLSTVINNLGSQLTPEQLNDPTGLYAKLTDVYKSMPSSSYDSEGWKKWVTDGYGGGGTTATGSGKISQMLDSAGNAATSFLNQTTEALQRFLNIMEQYYKSANEILKSTSENIKTYARGIAGR